MKVQGTHSRASAQSVPGRFQRGMARPDGGLWASGPGSPLLSLTRSRKPYGLVSREALADPALSDGALVLLAVQASLHRGGTVLSMSMREIAESMGVSLSTVYNRRRSLAALGYLENGALREAHRPAAVAKNPGGYVRVDLTAAHRLPPGCIRALAALGAACRRNRCRVRVATLARWAGKSVRAWHRAFRALTAAGWAWARGRWRGLGRAPDWAKRPNSKKRHTPFQRMSDLTEVKRADRKESGPAGPDGRFTPEKTGNRGRQPIRKPRTPAEWAAYCRLMAAGGVS